jgi:hypothetical protein
MALTPEQDALLAKVKAEHDALLAKQTEQRGWLSGKPTPTQEECDLAAMGASPDTLEADGSKEVVYEMVAKTVTTT